MTSKPTNNIVVLGGCIENQRPSDPSDGCSCYQVSFKICHNFKVHRITVCREWARYMAGLRVMERRRPEDAWSDVIKSVVRQRFPLHGNHYTRSHEVKSSTVRGLIEPLGYFPSHFREIVMDCRYGTIMNCIPIREIGERVFSDKYNMDDPINLPYRDKWYHGKNKWEKELIDANHKEWEKFRRVLDRIANHAKAIASMRESVRRKHYSTAEDFAAVLLHLTAMEAKKNQKTQQHEADEPKKPLPHSDGRH